MVELRGLRQLVVRAKKKLRTVVPVAVGIRDSAVQLEPAGRVRLNPFTRALIDGLNRDT